MSGLLANVAAYGAGWLTCWLLFYDRPRRIEMVMSQARRVSLSGITAIFVGLLFVGIGLQQLQYQSLNDEQARHDTAQRACLTKWGNDLSTTLLARTEANQDLVDAQTVKDDATDRVFRITNGLSSVPPRGTRQAFAAAVAERVAATANLKRVQRKFEATRRENPYPRPPELICGTDE